MMRSLTSGALAAAALLTLAATTAAAPTLPSLEGLGKEAASDLHPPQTLNEAASSSRVARTVRTESRNERYWSKRPKIEPQEWSSSEQRHAEAVAGPSTLPKNWLSLAPPGRSSRAPRSPQAAITVKREPQLLEVKKEPNHQHQHQERRLVTPKLEVKSEPTSPGEATIDSDPVSRPLPEHFGLPSLASLDEWRSKPRPRGNRAGYDEDRRMRVLAHIAHDWPYPKPLPGPARLSSKSLDAMADRRRKSILRSRRHRKSQDGPQMLSTDDSVEYLGEIGGKRFKDGAERYLRAFREFRDARPESQTPPPSP